MHYGVVGSVVSETVEQRNRTKSSKDPNGLKWKNDKNKFGLKIMKKMGMLINFTIITSKVDFNICFILFISCYLISSTFFLFFLV